MAVEEDHIATFDDVHAARPEQAWSITRDQEWPSTFRVWPGDVGCGGVAGIVERSGEAVGAEEEEVDALVAKMQGWGFDEWTVIVVAVEDLYGLTDQGDSVRVN